MKPWLMVLADPLSGERDDHELVEGASLAAELMRIFPEGIEGNWELYFREVAVGHEIDKANAAAITIARGDLVIMVRTPGTPDFWINLAIAALLSIASRLLTPTPRRAAATESEQRESGNNQLAGQTNVLRPGARVPEILGRVRSYPDLLTMPIERWIDGTTQKIEQFFVHGRGAYDIADRKLGETPLTSIVGASWQPFNPYDPDTDEVVEITAVKISTTVDSISLDAILNTAPPIAGVQFIASSKQMISPELLPVTAGAPTTISATLSNDGVFFVVSGPTGTGPYTYVLEGPVVNEPSSVPAFTAWTHALDTDRTANYGTAGGPPPVQNISFPGVVVGVEPGCAIAFTTAAAGTRYGTVLSVIQFGSPPLSPTTSLLGVKDMYGVNYSIVASGVPTHFAMFNPPEPALVARDVDETEADPTDWHAVPMANPDEVWIDIAFPGGLLKYESGVRKTYAVAVRADFRRAGDTTVATTRNLTGMSSSKQRYLQWTHAFTTASLAIPGSGPIEVRLQRTTPISPDTSTDQFISDTRWKQLRGVKKLPPRVYPDTTIERLGLTNTRSAISVGEQTYNAVITRQLPTWTGSAWSALAARRKWADNFVARLKADDGAGRTDDEIDITGIYALQAQLDAIDTAAPYSSGNGAAGEISLTLDQQQDIDAELAQIADVVRAVVYRVGRKVYVARDQANATAIALFNGRSKSAEAETIGMRMKADDENDAVLVQWVDEFSAFKVREYQYPPDGDALLPAGVATNVLRVGVLAANWPQAYRRARFEYARLKYRREQISVAVTEEGRICRPGDVVHITDDAANLALAAGEVIVVAGLVLTLDRDVSFAAPGTYHILLRDVGGVNVDAVPCVAVAGIANKVQLSRAPTVTIKGRDEALGTLYSFYNDAAVNVRKWLLTSVEANGPYVQLGGANYSTRVYEGDGATLPSRPVLEGGT